MNKWISFFIIFLLILSYGCLTKEKYKAILNETYKCNSTLEKEFNITYKNKKFSGLYIINKKYKDKDYFFKIAFYNSSIYFPDLDCYYKREKAFCNLTCGNLSRTVDCNFEPNNFEEICINETKINEYGKCYHILYGLVIENSKAILRKSEICFNGSLLTYYSNKPLSKEEKEKIPEEIKKRVFYANEYIFTMVREK